MIPGLRPLREALDGVEGFLQVVPERLLLESRGEGLLVIVELGPETPALLSSRDRRILAPRADPERGRDLEAAFLDARRADVGRRTILELEGFPLRVGSAGALPVLVGAGPPRVALFLRDLPPEGWNVANGGAAGIEELLDANLNLARELAEELLVFEAASGRVLRLPGAGAEADRAAASWAERLGAEVAPGAAPLLARGPDALEVRLRDGRRGRTEGLAIDFDPLGFGLECCRLARIAIADEAAPLDGEVAGGDLLDRPLGLFRPEALRGGDWRPETVLRGGRPGALPVDAVLGPCPVTARLVARGLLDRI